MPAGAFNACRTLTEQRSTISEIATNVYTNTLNALSSFAQQSDICFEKIQHSFNIINQIGNTISTFLQSVYIPELSEEQKEQLRCSHEAWGKYGWTQPPSVPITFLDRPPVDRKDATIKALKYCKNTDLERLFATLLGLPHAKKFDINEAIFDFKNRKYKSSALILFALIDACLIRLQRDDDRREKRKR